MAQLTKSHLAPLLQAFRSAVQSGAITIEDATDFHHDIEMAVFEERVRLHQIALDALRARKGKPTQEVTHGDNYAGVQG